MIVPGGRFREQYYWDTFFIIEGLLASDMYESAKAIVDNFVYVVDAFGFVPNGMRVYYLTRSQPPFLALMVARLYDERHDLAWVRSVMPQLARERDYWNTTDCMHSTDSTCVKDGKTVEVTVQGRRHRLSRYIANTSLPRPESYEKDVSLASEGNVPSDKRAELYKQIASGAETGPRCVTCSDVTDHVHRLGLFLALVQGPTPDDIYPHIRHCPDRPQRHLDCRR